MAEWVKELAASKTELGIVQFSSASQERENEAEAGFISLISILSINSFEVEAAAASWNWN